MQGLPRLSIIIPVFNGGETFVRCLRAVLARAPEGAEVLVVDDASTDGSGDRARDEGVRVLRTPKQSGPGGARNLGVTAATGEVVCFIDADCEPNEETFTRIATVFRDQPEVVAVFGSYDDSPAGRPFISQWKNLFHHFTHQKSRRESQSFWAGCGAVRRAVFLDLGGFNQVKYPRPSIEDIELGGRMSDRKMKICLEPGVTVKHHKVWTLGGMIRTDIFDRAAPWTRLMIETGRRTLDLNLDARSRLSGVLFALALVLLGIAVTGPGRWVIPLAALFVLLIVLANLDLYAFFLRRRGLAFALLSIPVHLLYFCYSMFGVAVGFSQHLVSILSRSSGGSVESVPETKP